MHLTATGIFTAIQFAIVPQLRNDIKSAIDNEAKEARLYQAFLSVYQMYATFELTDLASRIAPAPYDLFSIPNSLATIILLGVSLVDKYESTTLRWIPILQRINQVAVGVLSTILICSGSPLLGTIGLVSVIYGYASEKGKIPRQLNYALAGGISIASIALTIQQTATPNLYFVPALIGVCINYLQYKYYRPTSLIQPAN